MRLQKILPPSSSSWKAVESSAARDAHSTRIRVEQPWLWLWNSRAWYIPPWACHISPLLPKSHKRIDSNQLRIKQHTNIRT